MLCFLMLLKESKWGGLLISLGARQVPKYPSLANAIQDYVNEKIKESTE